MDSKPTQSSNLPSKVLVVDDDPAVTQIVVDQLGKYGIKVDRANNLESALYLFNTSRYDAVLLEMEFAPLPGLALVQKWRAHEILDKRSTPFIMMSGNKNTETQQAMFKELGDLGLITKPLTIPILLSHLGRYAEIRRRLASIIDIRTKVLNYYQKTGDFGKAADHLKTHLEALGPQGLGALYELYEKGGQLDEALKIVDTLLSQDQNNISLLNAKGRILLRQKKFAEAAEFIEKADAMAPLNIERINDLSQISLELNDGDKAQNAFERLVALNPEQPDVKYQYLDKLSDYGFEQQALNFGRSQASPLEIVKHYNNKGVMLSKSGKRDGAIQEYDRALKFYPKFKENYRILFNIALANINSKSVESLKVAQNRLKQCLALAPDFEKAKTTLKTVEELLAKLTEKKGA